MEHFGILMDYYNSMDILGTYPLKFVSSYFNDYYTEHNVKSTTIDLMKWANADTDDYNHFIEELYKTPLENIIPLVVRASNLSLLIWYIETNKNCILYHSMFNIGFEIGCIDILKWANDLGIPYDWKDFHTAIKYGHIHILQWMHHDQIIMKSLKQYKYKYVCQDYYAIDTECPTVAVKYKQLDILNWLINEKFPISQNTLIEAVINKDVIMLEWLWNYDVKPKKDDEWNFLLHAAVTLNNIDIVIWLMEKNPKLIFTTDTIYEAVAEEYWDILNYIEENHLLFDTGGLCITAAIGGSIDVMRWCITNGCIIDQITFMKAAEHGHIELFKWLMNENINSDISIDLDQLIKIILQILNIKYSESHMQILKIVHQLYLARNHIDDSHEINNFDNWFSYVNDLYRRPEIPNCT